MKKSIKEMIKDNSWPGYAHGYPHKKAYREISNINFKDIWECEGNEINIYVHIPFCKYKCHYCNLFSTTSHSEELFFSYVNKVIKQIEFYSNYISNEKIKSLYFGGGTPTILSIENLNRTIEVLKNNIGVFDEDIEICIESSPNYLSEEYIKGLRNIGIKRISLGVQSFNDKELKMVNRQHSPKMVYEVSEYCGRYDINLNIDLIYGLPNQDLKSSISSLMETIRLNPESICIYPLAETKLTGLKMMNKENFISMRDKYKYYDHLYSILIDNNYKSQSVVRFVKNNHSTYQQQRYEYRGIPTLGIGAGARSYSDNVHYSTIYKVEQSSINNIINDYINEDYINIKYEGFVFNEEEQKRKFAVLSLLDLGISKEAYKENFQSDLLEDFGDEINELKNNSLIYTVDNSLIKLTQKGRKYSDIIASSFDSELVKNLYENYFLK